MNLRIELCTAMGIPENIESEYFEHVYRIVNDYHVQTIPVFQLEAEVVDAVIVGFGEVSLELRINSPPRTFKELGNFIKEIELAIKIRKSLGSVKVARSLQRISTNAN